MAIAQSIAPPAFTCTPTPTPLSKIVLLSIGECNAQLEFGGDNNAFRQRASSDLAKSSNVVVINGAQASKDAKKWASVDGSGNPDDDCWSTAVTTLRQNGNYCPEQVAVVWMEHAVIDPGCPPYIPNDFYTTAESLHQQLIAITQNVLKIFPNCKMAFLSPRTESYVIYTDPSVNCATRYWTHNPEPFAYETGFADKWTIADQINGNAALCFNDPTGSHNQQQCTFFRAPYIAWGPYYWVNGTTPRSDFQTWNSWDLKGPFANPPDWVHPTGCGIRKVADQLLAFFETSPLTTPWFLNNNMTSLTAAPNYRACPNQGPNTFQFCADVTNAGTNPRYMWDFDDGDYVYDNPKPTKRFPAPGTYNVNLTVVDPSTGNHAQGSIPITVSP